MTAADRVRWFFIAGLAVLLIDLVAGMVRSKIDRTSMMFLEQSLRPAGVHWAVFAPECHTFIIGCYGSIRQVRENGRMIEIIAFRPLNVLPTFVSTRDVGWCSIVVAEPDKPSVQR